MVGPFTGETGGFLPADQQLPYTVHFQNDPAASSHVTEIRIVTALDGSLDARTFRLGDIQIGDIDIHVPADRAVFQGDFDFRNSLGFIVRVSAGVDLVAEEATWLVQAIDPLTGLVLEDRGRGLLPPNNARGQGAGFVSYTVRPEADLATGTTVQASARVLFNTAPPEDTPLLVQTLDGQAPASHLTATPVTGTDGSFVVSWNATDDPLGAGVKHVTVYVAIDGGDYRIWKRQVAAESGTDLYAGQAGRTYEFLSLATDVAGNRELPPFGACGG